MIAAYLRVSTKRDQSTDLQRNDIIRYLEFNGFKSSDIVFFDEIGVSGTKAERPQLARLIKDVENGHVTTVVVWKLDRLFRSFRHLLNTLHFFEERKVKFISVRDNLDLSTPTGRLMLNLLGSFAEFEVALIRERVKAGMKNAKEHGTKTGNPIGRPIEVDVGKVLALRKKQLSYVEIARSLNISKGKVARAIKKG